MVQNRLIYDVEEIKLIILNSKFYLAKNIKSNKSKLLKI